MEQSIVTFKGLNKARLSFTKSFRVFFVFFFLRNNRSNVKIQGERAILPK